MHVLKFVHSKIFLKSFFAKIKNTHRICLSVWVAVIFLDNDVWQQNFTLHIKWNFTENPDGSFLFNYFFMYAFSFEYKLPRVIYFLKNEKP